MKQTSIGSVGVKFQATLVDQDGTALDISGATTKEILFLAPDGGTLSKAATFGSDGTDGVMYYLTVAADLDEVGSWQWQAHVVTASAEWWSEIATVRVVSPLA